MSGSCYIHGSAVFHFKSTCQDWISGISTANGKEQSTQGMWQMKWDLSCAVLMCFTFLADLTCSLPWHTLAFMECWRRRYFNSYSQPAVCLNFSATFCLLGWILFMLDWTIWDGEKVLWADKEKKRDNTRGNWWREKERGWFRGGVGWLSSSNVDRKMGDPNMLSEAVRCEQHY